MLIILSIDIATMMKILQRQGFILSLILFFSTTSDCQVYEDHLGAGQTIGVSVSSSPFSSPDTSLYSISGTALIPDLTEASRFLSQATLGVNYEEIEHVSTIGIKAWLDEQIALPPTSYMERWDEIYAETQTLISNPIHANQYISFTFYDVIFNDSDYLRQKVGFALSQIFVISRRDVLSGEADALMPIVETCSISS